MYLNKNRTRLLIVLSSRNTATGLAPHLYSVLVHNIDFTTCIHTGLLTLHNVTIQNSTRCNNDDLWKDDKMMMSSQSVATTMMVLLCFVDDTVTVKIPHSSHNKQNRYYTTILRLKMVILYCVVRARHQRISESRQTYTYTHTQRVWWMLLNASVSHNCAHW